MNKLTDAVDSFLALDELAARKTAIHALHPMAKLIASLVFIVAVVSSPRFDAAALLPYFIFIAATAALAEISFSVFFRRILPVLPFILFAGLSNVIFLTETGAVVLGVAVSKGVLAFVVLLLKTVLTVSSVILLSATTPSNEIFAQLRRLGIPSVLTTVCMLCFRYLSLLMQEAGSMTRAYHLRSVRAKGVDMRDCGPFAGQLILRSMDRAGRVYAAMRCRGFTGTFDSRESGKMNAASWAYMLLLSIAFIAQRIWGLQSLYSLIF